MGRFAAIAENLAGLSPELDNLELCRLAHLREAALLLCKGATPEAARADIDSFREKYSQACNELGSPSDDDRITLCAHVGAVITENMTRAAILEQFFSPEGQSAEPVICYLRNPIADLAYTEFSRNKNASVLYGESFSAVCENLSNGDCDYAILPVISGSDGRLVRFENMITANAFVVSALAEVAPSPEHTPDTFALLSRGIELPRDLESARLCYSFTVQENADLACLITAAKRAGLGTISFGTTSNFGRKSFALTLDITSGKIEEFFAYLALEEPGFVNTGLFTLKEPD